MQTSQSPEIEDEKLVVLAQSGNRQAFGMLVERHMRKAYRIAFDFCRDREEAKDLSQEAFLRSFASLKNFDRRSSFSTWLTRILINLCLDHRRRNGRWRWEPFEMDGSEARKPWGVSTAPSMDRRMMDKEISARVEKALQDLPPKQRMAFVLKNDQGLKIREIANMMQSAEGTVKVHLHRAVLALRRRLADMI